MAIEIVRAFREGEPLMQKLTFNVLVNAISPVRLRQAADFATSWLACLPSTRMGLELACGGLWRLERLLNEPTEPVMKTS